jgi:hypothetical protein
MVALDVTGAVMLIEVAGMPADPVNTFMAVHPTVPARLTPPALRRCRRAPGTNLGTGSCDQQGDAVANPARRLLHARVCVPGL